MSLYRVFWEDLSPNGIRGCSGVGSGRLRRVSLYRVFWEDLSSNGIRGCSGLGSKMLRQVSLLQSVLGKPYWFIAWRICLIIFIGPVY